MLLDVRRGAGCSPARQCRSGFTKPGALLVDDPRRSDPSSDLRNGRAPMARRPVGQVWVVANAVDNLYITVVPDKRSTQGTWLCKVADRRNGRRKQTWHATEAEARAKAETFVQARTSSDSGAPTVGGLIEKYIQRRRVLNTTRRTSTGQTQESSFRHIRATWAEKPPEAVTEDAVLAWLGTLHRAPLG